MKATDHITLSQNYMKAYNEIAEKYHNSDIQQLVDKLNDAVESKDMEVVNENYSKILDWNFMVAALDGACESLKGQFPSLRLPSPLMFTIIFDENEKIWKFNS